MYKIFFKDRALFLTKHIDSVLTPDFGAIHKLGSDGELKKFLRDFENNEKRKEAFIYHYNEFELLQRVRKCYKNLPAAGGLVWNPARDAFLGITRRGRNDLPKGKVEPDETFEAAAIREVQEECNIESLCIKRPLISTFHIYYIDEVPILKETMWFEMIYNGNKNPSPQKEEDITAVEWVNLQNIDKFVRNAFPSVREVIETSLNRLLDC